MLKIIFTTLLYLLALNTHAQNIIIQGKVVSNETNNPIEYATVTINGNNTFTDSKGDFKLAIGQNDLSKSSLKISCIGYQTNIIYPKLTLNSIYKLKIKTINLVEVKVIDKGLSIIQKAILKIPKNFTQKEFLMDGFIRIYHLSNDSSKKQSSFYKNDAFVKIEHPSYNSKSGNIKTMLIKNQYLSKNNYDTEDTLHRVNGYRIVNDADLIFYKNDFLNLNRLKDYMYSFLEETIYKNRNTYLISFKEKKKNGSTGIIFIDVNTFAIVKIDVQEFDINRFPIRVIDSESKQVEYTLVNNQWYLDRININLSGKHGAINYSTIKELKVFNLDTNSNFKIPYQNVVQNLSETIKLNEIVKSSERESFNKLIDSIKEGSNITELDLPTIYQDSIMIKKSSIAHNIMNYYRNGYRFLAKINKLPYDLHGFQPIIGENITRISNYSFSTFAQLKIYKPIYFEWGNYRNYGLGGISSNLSTYSINYNIEFNKKGHPWFITPNIGYSTSNISKKKENYFKQKNLSVGINLTYEKSHLLSYVLSLNYFEPLSSTNKGLIIQQYKLLPSIGIQLKLN